MAKRKREVVIRNIVNNLYEAWMDDDILERVRELPSVQEVYKRGLHGAPWGIKFDPRYDAADVIAEIEGLADGREPCQEDAPESLEAEARDLGNRAANRCVGSAIVRECLRAVDDNYAKDAEPDYSLEWLPSVEREIRAIREKRGLEEEPQPEQSLAEAARALGLRAADDCQSVALDLLRFAEETTSEDYETTLGGIIIAIARRLRRGDWC